MLEAALFGHDRVPGHVLHLAHDRLAVEVAELDTFRRNYGQITVGKEEQITRVVENGRHVGSNKVLVFPETDYCGRTVARSHDLVWLLDGNYRQGENAREFPHRLAHGFFEGRPVSVAGLEEILFNEVGDNLGIRLGRELMAFFDQFFLQKQVVLDDTVMYDDDLPGAVTVRVRVLLGRPSVGSPAGMSNAIGSIERLQPDNFFQVAQLAFGAADLQAGAIPRNCNAGRVITTVLEPLQAINDHRNNALFTNVSHDSAHSDDSSFSAGSSESFLANEGCVLPEQG